METNATRKQSKENNRQNYNIIKLSPQRSTNKYGSIQIRTKVNQSETTLKYFDPLRTHKYHTHTHTPCLTHTHTHTHSHTKLVLGLRHMKHVVQKQVSYASILKQASPPPPSNTFNFTAEQIVSLVTNVVIQVALPQLCTKNLPEKQVQVKSDLSRQIAETAKKCLGVSIEGKEVFESIISRPAPPPPAPFVFRSTLVEKKKAPLKASTVLKVTPTPSSSTKSTKTLSSGPHRKSSSKLSPPQPRLRQPRQSLPNSHHDHHPHTANLRTRVLAKSPQ